jgi:hypothetical protein
MKAILNRRLYNFVRLHNFFINDHNYRQLVSAFITDKQTLIDNFYTNLAESKLSHTYSMCIEQLLSLKQSQSNQ